MSDDTKIELFEFDIFAKQRLWSQRFFVQRFSDSDHPDAEPDACFYSLMIFRYAYRVWD